MSDVASTGLARRYGRAPLLQRLVARGWEFDFFQAVWLLERSTTEQARVGGRGPVAREIFRFRPDVGLGFPSVDLLEVREQRDPVDDRTRYRMDVTFLGLYGVSTPLPLHYAVRILRSVEPAGPIPSPGADTAQVHAAEAHQEGGSPVRDFLDILHHRLISLFYRAWTKYRYYTTFAVPERDVMSDYWLWLIGCSPDWTRAELGVHPVRMIRYAGLFTQRPRSAAGLEGLLSDYWGGLPVQVKQCVGRQVALHRNDLNRIGLANSRLGLDLTVGEEVYDLSGCFTACLGPVGWEDYVSLLPDGTRFAQTRSLTRLYCQDSLAFDVEILLRAAEVPATQLSSDEQAARLGFTSWLRTEEMPATSVLFDAA